MAGGNYLIVGTDSGRKQLLWRQMARPPPGGRSQGWRPCPALLCPDLPPESREYREWRLKSGFGFSSSCQSLSLSLSFLFLMTFTPFPGDSFAIEKCCLFGVCSRVPADDLSSRKAHVGKRWWVVRTKGLSWKECTFQGCFLVQTIEILRPQKV